MKKVLLIFTLLIIAENSYSQSISYNQLQRILKTWVAIKATSAKPISQRLQAISPNWKFQSESPNVKQDTKMILWTALESKSDTSFFALFVEEDDTTVKYYLRYAFYNKALYNSIYHSIKTSIYYQRGRVTTLDNKSSGEYTLTAMASDDLPMVERIDATLSDYNAVNSGTPRLFAIDISTRYVKKLIK